ncbi:MULTISPECIES: DUF2332 domain-containing protein [Mycolicibacterium]|uniref:DUF2332 domain-containing protein n=1 Tax=Mycolicibacterium wolinskyi TaxID=59750 RepID=A0A1X2EZE8_9MYCO|nr:MULTISPECIES: DUF2332 family protein [Mycolicibacterium]ORX11562.1 hypothetical protein AWC31_33275 [Mycolicibacterium wolinskyi]
MSDRLLGAFDVQARACAALGSPMYAELLDLVLDDIRSRGIFADVLAGHEDDPGPSGLALRLLGGLHRLVLDGRAPALAAWYPSVGGHWDAAAAWPEILATARRQTAYLRAMLDQPPQTNEVGRSAALIGGLLHLVDRFPLPVRLFEIGSSAGLNLRADHYLYRHAGGQWGPADSAVVIEDAWHGALPPAAPLRIAHRHGFDIAPVDARTEDGRLTLLSYVWPDMTARLHRLSGAIDIARRVDADLDRMPAAEAVSRLQLTPGTLTVLWHSVTWQYLGAAEQHAVETRLKALGSAATANTPFAWLNLEPQRRAPDAHHEFLIRVQCWPDGADRILGSCAPHGPPVHWE